MAAYGCLWTTNNTWIDEDWISVTGTLVCNNGPLICTMAVLVPRHNCKILLGTWLRCRTISVTMNAISSAVRQSRWPDWSNCMDTVVILRSWILPRMPRDMVFGSHKIIFIVDIPSLPNPTRQYALGTARIFGISFLYSECRLQQMYIQPSGRATKM